MIEFKINKIIAKSLNKLMKNEKKRTLFKKYIYKFLAKSTKGILINC